MFHYSAIKQNATYDVHDYIMQDSMLLTLLLVGLLCIIFDSTRIIFTAVSQSLLQLAETKLQLF